jgi:type VI secretion system protein VasJ
MADLARALRQADPSDPRAYALVRHALWFTIANEPPVSNQTAGSRERPTEIPAPDIGELEVAKRRLSTTSDPRALVDMIDRLEVLILDSPFWLDPHRFVVQALTQLGEAYAAARKTVAITTLAFVQRLPGVLNLAFLSGHPFAGSETRAWIEDSALVGGNTSSNRAGAASALADTEAKARKLASEDKAREGLSVFVGSRRMLSSERERFEWDLAQAKYCRDYGLGGVALSLLENLEGPIAERRLEDWEPTWVIEHAIALLGLYNAEHAEAGAANAHPARRDAVRRVFSRLSRLDPIAAIGFADLVAGAEFSPHHT